MYKVCVVSFYNLVFLIKLSEKNDYFVLVHPSYI